MLAGESTLGLLNFALQLAHGTLVGRDVGTGLLLVGLGEVVNDTVVEVLATKVGVSGSGQDLEDAVIDGEKGNIESSTTEIVYDDLGFTALLVETVCNGGCRGFVDNTQDLKPSDRAGILSGLALSVVEV